MTYEFIENIMNWYSNTDTFIQFQSKSSTNAEREVKNDSEIYMEGISETDY